MKIRISTLNCENLFSRPKIFSANNAAELLGKVNELNEALRQPVFDHQKINQLLNQLKGYVEVVDVRSTLDSAQGPSDWLGWVDLKRARNSDAAIKNTARVLAAINADIQCLCEVENRPLLNAFHDQLLWPYYLKPDGKQPFTYNLVIDGNDERGIDVAVMSRYPIVSMRTHMFETTIYQGKEVKLFSRDCLEIGVEVQAGVRIDLLLNHLKSMGYNPPGDPNSNQRRLQQALRVVEIADAYSLDQAYVVVAGDLNSPPTSPSLAPLVSHPKLYNVNLELPEAERGTFHTGKQQLDYLFISPALRQKLTGMHIERRGAYAKTKWQPFDTVTKPSEAASDHSAVVAEFQI